MYCKDVVPYVSFELVSIAICTFLYISDIIRTLFHKNILIFDLHVMSSAAHAGHVPSIGTSDNRKKSSEYLDDVPIEILSSRFCLAPQHMDEYCHIEE